MGAACVLAPFVVVVPVLSAGQDRPLVTSEADDTASNSPADTNNWPRFRGPQSIPVSDNPNLPDSWSTTENVEWVAEVPGVGWSSPIVWGKRIFLTAATSEQSMK